MLKKQQACFTPTLLPDPLPREKNKLNWGLKEQGDRRGARGCHGDTNRPVVSGACWQACGSKGGLHEEPRHRQGKVGRAGWGSRESPRGCTRWPAAAPYLHAASEAAKHARSCHVHTAPFHQFPPSRAWPDTCPVARNRGSVRYSGHSRGAGGGSCPPARLPGTTWRWLRPGLSSSREKPGTSHGVAAQAADS